MIRRIAAASLILVLGAVLLLSAWPQLFGLQYVPPFAQVVALRAPAAAVALAVAIVLLALVAVARPFRRLGAALATLLLVFVAVSAAVLGSRGFDGEGVDAANDDELTVLVWNTQGDAPGSQAIADLAIEVNADIVSLPETSEEASIEVAEIMKAAGAPMWVHHVSFDKVAKARTTSLLTSVDLGTYSVDESRGNTQTTPSVIATSDDGSAPTIVAAHPVAPIAGYFDDWREGLEWLQDACTGENIIMAGDLNSTIDHYGRLRNSPEASIGDCVDAAAVNGNAAVGTWPTDIPAPFGTSIDHVMATDDWRVTGVQVIQDLDDTGSDHRPVVAQYLPAG